VIRPPTAIYFFDLFLLSTVASFALVAPTNVLCQPHRLGVVLLHVFENQFGAKLSTDELLAKLGDDEGEPFDISPVYTEIREKCTAVPSLEIKEFTSLGNFAFQKIAMVKDLQERAQELSDHDIISAIAGDTDARSSGRIVM
jgi:hypothetical protein